MDKIELGGIEVFTDEAEQYVQINDPTEADLSRLREPLAARFPGWEVTLCFRNVPIPEKALAELNATVLEDCVRTRMTPADVMPCNGTNAALLPEAGDGTYAVLLPEADFEEFAALHDSIDHGMFWTGPRIKEKRSKWRIFAVYEAGRIIGYTMLCVKLRTPGLGEIFCVHADEPAQRIALLAAATRHAFENGKTEIIYMVDRDNPAEMDAALAVGFRDAGFYTAYTFITGV